MPRAYQSSSRILGGRRCGLVTPGRPAVIAKSLPDPRVAFSSRSLEMGMEAHLMLESLVRLPHDARHLQHVTAARPQEDKGRQENEHRRGDKENVADMFLG